MKKILPVILLAIIIIGIFYLDKLSRYKNKQPSSKDIQKIHQVTEKITEIKTKKSIFVPDWTTQDATLSAQYDRLIYFGDISKIKTQDNQWFTLKITDLPDESSWSQMIEKTVNIAKNYNLTGIVLDLEISELPTDALVTQINNFVQNFRKQLEIKNLKLGISLYGDTFYRKRPYDVKFLADNSDEIMIMAYDFHKSRGEPGPNFQFLGREKYGYDFKEMIDNFLQFVPAEKLTIIFGMYGYNWSVDEKRRTIMPAPAMTLNEIRKKFLTKCEWKDCLVKRDNLSKETEVDYVQSVIQDNYAYLYYHIVWFEDEQSVAAKTEYLNQMGIGSIAYWANGYF